MDNLLREIDCLRDTTPLPQKAGSSASQSADKPTSRPKRRCRFGPRPRNHTTGQEIGDVPPSTPAAIPLPTNQEHPAQPDCVPNIVDIPTLMPPGPSQRSPLDHYKHTAENRPQPDPHRFVLQRLGLTAEEFDARVTEEIDERLRVARNERLLARLATPVIEGLEPLTRILTKEDCMTLFRATGVPPPGPLWGVYCWAANLGQARYNFMEDLEEQDYHLLDALD